MTRRSKREIERAVDDLDADPGDDDTLSVVFRDGATGDYYADGDMTDPVDLDDLPGMPVVLTRGVVVMFREDAEREGREILGPAEGTPEGVDAVRVRSE